MVVTSKPTAASIASQAEALSDDERLLYRCGGHGAASTTLLITLVRRQWVEFPN
jgi:hypothetical protein